MKKQIDIIEELIDFKIRQHKSDESFEREIYWINFIGYCLIAFMIIGIGIFIGTII